MCQTGNNLPYKAHGFADAQASLELNRHDVRLWRDSAAPDHTTAALVAQHIISRLVAGHAFRLPERLRKEAEATQPCGEIGRFVDLLLGPDNDAPARAVAERRLSGASCEATCHDLLEPAARCLRLMWRHDDCDYAAFRLGLWRLRRLLQEVDHTNVCRRAAHRDPAAAIMITLPGAEPTFEHTLVSHSFARSGWTAENHSAEAPLQVALLGNRFHVAWICIGEGTRLAEIAACVRTVRRLSKNRSIGILCGGAGLDPLPASWEVGADAMVPDARTALAVAERWRMWQAEDEAPRAAVA